MGKCHSGDRQGRVSVVGIGPGNPLDRTRRAENAIAESEVVVGYTKYLETIRDLTNGKELISSGMTKEVDRCRAALVRAAEGAQVALVSSGDAGIYGMAGLVLEMANALAFEVSIDIIAGVSAAQATAARLGAPLMLDVAYISLSDLLVPWKRIERRVKAVAAADLVVALYNPRSRKRIKQLDRAAEIFREYRSNSTVVGIGTAVSTANERIVVTDLENFLSEDIGMNSIVIIGNSQSRAIDKWFVTPRGYQL